MYYFSVFVTFSCFHTYSLENTWNNDPGFSRKSSRVRINGQTIIIIFINSETKGKRIGHRESLIVLPHLYFWENVKEWDRSPNLIPEWSPLKSHLCPAQGNHGVQPSTQLRTWTQRRVLRSVMYRGETWSKSPNLSGISFLIYKMEMRVAPGWFSQVNV